MRSSTMLPLLWILLTAFKTPADSIAYPPKILFTPSVEGYVNLFTTRSRQTPEFLAKSAPAADLVRASGARPQHGDRRAVEGRRRAS